MSIRRVLEVDSRLQGPQIRRRKLFRLEVVQYQSLGRPVFLNSHLVQEDPPPLLLHRNVYLTFLLHFPSGLQGFIVLLKALPVRYLEDEPRRSLPDLFLVLLQSDWLLELISALFRTSSTLLFTHHILSLCISYLNDHEYMILFKPS